MDQRFRAFVAAAEIPPAPPPPSERGAIRWARENLFSSVANGLLTILSAAFLVWLVASLWPWFADGVWDAASLDECRQRGEGGCFAVIAERFRQFMFGFYPADAYWRPVLAFLCLLAAMAPVLFVSLPRQLLWFTAIFPALAYFLLFGGSVWGPVLVLAGFAAGWFLFALMSGTLGSAGAAILAALASAVWMIVAVAPIDDFLHGLIPVGLEAVPSEKIGGFTLTLIIGVTGIAGSLPIGILLALGRRSNLFVVRAISVGFIEFIRGVPLITLLFVASTLLNIFLPPGTDFDKLLRVLILVVLFSSAYMAETIRGGLAAIPKGQFEAADALGLDYWKSMRHIVLPQALKISIPGIVNNFIGLFKDTTLVSVIAMLDPLGMISPIRSDPAWNGVVWELFGFVALFFFICCFGMSRYSQYLERRLKTDHR
jgi:general L-amino acid transport system permease protein